MKRRLALIIVLCLLGGLALGIGGRLLWLRRVPDAAAKLIAGRKVSTAQKMLQTYLFWYRGDTRARLLLAEAFTLDDASQSAADDALDQLQWIPNTAPQGAEARFREGQLRFLLLHQPAAAERHLRQALQLRPDFLPAITLLWKLLDVTGRQPDAAALFWKIYELCPPEEHAFRLREAYLSEFSPGSASFELDRAWGLLEENELSSPASELRRYELFMRDEPQAALSYAAAILWCVENKQIARAAELQAQAVKLPEASREPLLSAATIAVALEQGQFETASRALDAWPEPRDGYEFFKYQGTILEEVRQDLPGAVTAYKSALATETGDADWTTQNRLAHCYRKLIDIPAAEAVQKQAKIVEQLMERNVHQRIRTGLANLTDPRALSPVLQLYQRLGRRRSIDAWQRIIVSLSAKQRI